MKKLTALLLALVMIFSLTACDGTGGETDGGNSSGESAAWTEKNVEVQLAAAAGGGTDVVGRALTNYINQQGEHNLTIINNTDGGGVVAFENVRNSDPEKADTLLFFHTTMIIKTASHIYDKSATEDFTVITVAEPSDPGSYILVVPADSPYQTMEEFDAAVMSGLLAQAIGGEMSFVEAGSDTEKMTALMSGSIDCAIVNANSSAQYIEAGKAIGLGCFSTSNEGGRSSILPDVPSFIELGYEDLSFALKFFVLGPKGMDPAVCEEIADAFIAAAEDPATQEILTNAGQACTFLPYEESLAVVQAQVDQLTPVVEALGLVQD